MTQEDKNDDIFDLFRVGQKVICIDCDNPLLTLGMVYTVKDVDNGGKFVYFHELPKWYLSRRFKDHGEAVIDKLLEKYK